MRPRPNKMSKKDQQAIRDKALRVKRSKMIFLLPKRKGRRRKRDEEAGRGSEDNKERTEERTRRDRNRRQAKQKRRETTHISTHARMHAHNTSRGQASGLGSRLSCKQATKVGTALFLGPGVLMQEARPCDQTAAVPWRDWNAAWRQGLPLFKKKSRE